MNIKLFYELFVFHAFTSGARENAAKGVDFLNVFNLPFIQD